MATKVTGDLRAAITDQLFEIGRQIRQPHGYPFDPLQLKESLQAIVEGRFGSTQSSVLPDIDWFEVYRQFGMTKELNNFLCNEVSTDTQVCEHPTLWPVPVIKGITYNKIVEAYRRLDVVVSRFAGDLDREIAYDDRDPKNGSYIVKFKKTVEADPELASRSADDLKKQGVAGITLLERLFLELGYFLTTGQHLDVESATLCSGSRYSGGGVPYVSRYLGSRRGLRVDWDYADDRSPNLRSRVVRE